MQPTLPTDFVMHLILSKKKSSGAFMAWWYFLIAVSDSCFKWIYMNDYDLAMFPILVFLFCVVVKKQISLVTAKCCKSVFLSPQGRNPFFLEPSVIITITDGNKLTHSSGVPDEVRTVDLPLDSGCCIYTAFKYYGGFCSSRSFWISSSSTSRRLDFTLLLHLIYTFSCS